MYSDEFQIVGKLSQHSDSHPAKSIKLINVDSEQPAEETNYSFETLFRREKIVL